MFNILKNFVKSFGKSLALIIGRVTSASFCHLKVAHIDQRGTSANGTTTSLASILRELVGGSKRSSLQGLRVLSSNLA